MDRFQGAGSVLLGAAILSALIWTVLGHVRATMAIAESYLYLATLTALVVLLGSTVARLSLRYIEPNQDALAVLVVWWILCLLSALVVPGASYLFVWPSLVGSLFLLLRPISASRSNSRLIEWGAVSAITLILLIPAIDFLYQLPQPRPGNPDSQILQAVAIPIALVALGFELLRAFRRKELA